MAGFILGLIIGSFLATVVLRWPEGKSAMQGRSACDSCSQQLGMLELIPVISYLWLSGKCRRCGEKISTDHFAIELTAGLMAGIALFIAPGVDGLAGAIFGWILLCLAALDAKHQWLPDSLTAILAGTGLIGALMFANPSIVERLTGGLLGYFSLLLIAIVYRTLRNREGLGGGDPKMLGAIGCWLGWQALPLVLLGASFAGLIAVMLMKLRGCPVGADSKIPLGSLMAVAAFPIWLIQTSGIELLG